MVAKCLIPDCDNRQHSRGVCGSCYNAARRAVCDGRTTWQQLQAAGLVLAASRVRNSMSVALAKLRRTSHAKLA